MNQQVCLGRLHLDSLYYTGEIKLADDDSYLVISLLLAHLNAWLPREKTRLNNMKILSHF
jgi:hypothetical protein